MRDFSTETGAMPHPQINRERIRAARKLIQPHIRRTPLVEADGRDLFKARGAFIGVLICGGNTTAVDFRRTGPQPQMNPPAQNAGPSAAHSV
jgi:hypothetical protein